MRKEQQRGSSEYAAVDHPGITIPHGWGPWDVSWPDYDPVEITPPELRADTLDDGHVPGWVVDDVASPNEVDDWPTRKACGLVPFAVTGHGWPLHPHGRTGRAGRNLPKWGENQAADPIVLAGTGQGRHVLLIARSDGAGWAIPGGMVDAGETAPAATVRELREETGVDLREQAPTVLARQIVADWRATDHAWVATTAALFALPGQVTATAGDDAAAAGWFPASTLVQLDAAIQQVDEALYEAHRELLTLALAEADRQQQR